MNIKIEEEYFEAKEISQLYPAAVIKTGEGDETTQVSLSWVEKEGKGKVELVGYGLFVHIGEEKFTFMYDTREEMDKVASSVAEQVKKHRDGR